MKNSAVALALALCISACGGAQQDPTTPATPVTPTTPPVTVAPPEPAKGTPIALKNASFDANAQGKIADWSAIEHNNGNSYTFVADPADAYSQPSSGRIRRHGPEVFGRLEQVLKIQPAWIGKTVRLSGMLKSADIDGPGGALVIQATTGSGDQLAWNHMDGQRVRGTQGWKAYAIDVKIPPDTYFLRVGVLLEEGGTLWADDLSLVLLD